MTATLDTGCGHSYMYFLDEENGSVDFLVKLRRQVAYGRGTEQETDDGQKMPEVIGHFHHCNETGEHEEGG
jgi:hypothetical protein